MKHVSVLDDDEVLRKVLQGMLKSYDYEVTLFESEEALFAPGSDFNGTDLLLLDIYVGDENGIETLKKIKEDPTYQSLPVIMITSDSKDATLEECFLCGAYDYILKPFNEKALKSRVDRALNQSFKFKRLESEIVYFRAQSKTIYDKNQEYKERIRSLEMFHQELSRTTQHLAAATWRERQREEELNQALEDLQVAQDKAEKSRRKVIDSIQYAKKIQSAFLPADDVMVEVFPQSFVFYRPKDIVSGDFYWCWKNGPLHFLGAFDCTGHGVPGAFMSLIGMSLVNEIVRMQGCYQLDDILNKLHEGVVALLNQQRIVNNDRMDASLCCIDREKQVLYYSGAVNPLVYFKDNVSHVLPGTRLSIGGKRPHGNKSFELHEVPLEGITEIYLFSDGFRDQFGGIASKKIGMRNLTALLTDIHQRPVEAQRLDVQSYLTNWMNATEPSHKQIDDILLIGARLSS